MIAESRFVQPADGVVVVRRPSVRSAAARESAIHRAADVHVAKLEVAFRYAFARGRQALGTPPNATRASKAIEQALRKTLRPTLLACMKAGGEVALGGLRTLGDLPGHEFHGNQWTKAEPDRGEPGSPERMQHVAWEHGKTWRDKSAKLDAIKKKDAKDVNWSRDWEADTRVTSIAQAQDEIDHFKDREERARDTAKSMRGAELRTLKPPLKKKIGPINLTFDIKNARAAKWALEHVGWLIESIANTTRERIQEAVARAQIDGDLKQQYEDILAAVGDEDRAQVIARTESMTAVNAGQREGWDQAVDAGLLPKDATVSWIATDVDACPLCEALDGTTRALDGEYPDGVFPPLHPNCRCTESISG